MSLISFLAHIDFVGGVLSHCKRRFFFLAQSGVVLKRNLRKGRYLVYAQKDRGNIFHFTPPNKMLFERPAYRELPKYRTARFACFLGGVLPNRKKNTAGLQHALDPPTSLSTPQCIFFVRKPCPVYSPTKVLPRQNARQEKYIF